MGWVSSFYVASHFFFASIPTSMRCAKQGFALPLFCFSVPPKNGGNADRDEALSLSIHRAPKSNQPSPPSTPPCACRQRCIWMSPPSLGRRRSTACLWWPAPALLWPRRPPSPSATAVSANKVCPDRTLCLS